MHRGDDIAVFHLHRLPRLIFGKEHLVHLLDGPDANLDDFAVGSHGFGQVRDPHARNLRDEDFSSRHGFDRRQNKSHALLDGHPEACHTRVRYGDPAGLALLTKKRDHASTASHHVSVAYATEANWIATAIGIRLYEQFLGDELGGAVQIDGVDGLVGAQRQDSLHAVVQRSFDDVLRAVDVGLDGFDGVRLARGYLLQRRRVDDHIDSHHGTPQAVQIAHVADEIAETGIVESTHPHFVLFQFVAAKDDQALRIVLAKEDLRALPSERPGAAGN